MSIDADHETGSDSSTIDEELQELQKLQGLLRCKICKARRVALTFLPCGHCVTCEECGPKVLSCPICPKNVAQVQRTVKTIFAP
ncbi:baculoviral IAP repeat-containing protein 8-like [Dreissena polymorpha]|nr:baculoviral IAP repeat-containing protein 8-like [Dreissena polymorpha]